MNNSTKEIIGVGVTAARYGMAEWIARRVRDNKPIAIPMAAFIAADILDGVILRKFDMDTPVRRVADGVVDHASEIRVAAEVAKKYPETRKYIGGLAVRAAAVGIMNGIHLLKTGEVTKGQSKQRLTNLATGAFGVIATQGNTVLTEVSGATALGIAVATAPHHLKGLGEVHDGVARRL